MAIGGVEVERAGDDVKVAKREELLAGGLANARIISENLMQDQMRTFIVSDFEEC